MLTYFEKGFGERRWFCGDGAVIEGGGELGGLAGGWVGVVVWKKGSGDGRDRRDLFLP